MIRSHSQADWQAVPLPIGKWLIRLGKSQLVNQSITYLIAPLEPAVLRGGARLEDGLDVDGHVAVRAPEPAHDGEPQAVLATLQLDHLKKGWQCLYFLF